MDLQRAIKSRHSVRKFKSTEPDWRDIIEAIDSARFSPMAGDMNTLKIIMVKDPEKIAVVSNATEQNFVSQTKYIVIFCSKSDRTKRSFKEKGDVYSRQQAGAAMQNFWLSLTEKGLSSCWIGHFDEKKIKTELRIPDDLDIEAIFPIGYEFKKPERKEKTPLDNILYFDIYGNKKMYPPKRIE
jgi:nitroreductase